MAERIYVTTAHGRIEPLEETAFVAGNELQRLIAEHPELLDGKQMRPVDSRRWLLINGEKGIAEARGRNPQEEPAVDIVGFAENSSHEVSAKARLKHTQIGHGRGKVFRRSSWCIGD